MNLGILLWNKCNVACAHCAVSSGPDEKAILTDEQIFLAIDACFDGDDEPKIGLSGGEAFLYYDRLCRIVEYASKKGAKLSVNTNCSWAINEQKARDRLAKLKGLGLTKLVVSTDQFHKEFIPEERVILVIRLCKELHVEVDLQFVSTKKTERLSQFMLRHQDALLNISSREIPCHPVGRAAIRISEDELFLEKGIPKGLCPSAVLSISAKGDVIPCCNTAGHLPTLRVGNVDEPIRDLYDKFTTSSVMQVLCSEGPSALMNAALDAGYRAREDGYIDQCHLCYELFRDEKIALAVKEEAANKMTRKVYASISGAGVCISPNATIVEPVAPKL